MEGAVAIRWRSQGRPWRPAAPMKGAESEAHGQRKSSPLTAVQELRQLFGSERGRCIRTPGRSSMSGKAAPMSGKAAPMSGKAAPMSAKAAFMSAKAAPISGTTAKRSARFQNVTTCPLLARYLPATCALLARYLCATCALLARHFGEVTVRQSSAVNSLYSC